MKFEPLDTFKLIPISVSWIAGVGLLEMLNPLGYTTMQYYQYGLAGATIGGLYSISYLGGFAKEGNRESLKKMAVVMAVVFAFDAPIVRDKIIDMTVSPKYSAYKKEYLKVPKLSSLTQLRQKLAKAKSAYAIEKAHQKRIDIAQVKSNNEKAKTIYLTHYKEYGWWNSKAQDIGCISYTSGLTNQKERERRLECISNSLYVPSNAIELNNLDLIVGSLKSDIKLIKSANFETKHREDFLIKEITKAESGTLPMWSFYIVMFFIGWILEVFLPHLKHWMAWQNHEANRSGKTLTMHTKEMQENETRKLLQFTDDFLSVVSTKSNAENWVKKVLGENINIDRKINVFFALISAIRNDEEKLTIPIVQKYSWFTNPQTGKKFNTQNQTTKIRKLFERNKISKDNMPIILMEEILKKIQKL